MNHPKTIKYNGRRYLVAFVTEDAVVVELHQDEIYGFRSRMTLPKPKRWLKYRS